MPRSILALCRRPPYGDALAREGLEAVLAAAAMEQAPVLLFMHDGVFQLLKDQNAKSIEQKSVRRNLEALSIFGIDKLYVCQHSLEKRNLNCGQFRLPGIEIELIADPGHFIAAFDSVLSF